MEPASADALCPVRISTLPEPWSELPVATATSLSEIKFTLDSAVSCTAPDAPVTPAPAEIDTAPAAAPEPEDTDTEPPWSSLLEVDPARTLTEPGVPLLEAPEATVRSPLSEPSVAAPLPTVTVPLEDFTLDPLCSITLPPA